MFLHQVVKQVCYFHLQQLFNRFLAYFLKHCALLQVVEAPFIGIESSPEALAFRHDMTLWHFVITWKFILLLLRSLWYGTAVSNILATYLLCCFFTISNFPPKMGLRGIVSWEDFKSTNYIKMCLINILPLKSWSKFSVTVQSPLHMFSDRKRLRFPRGCSHSSSIQTLIFFLWLVFLQPPSSLL